MKIILSILIFFGCAFAEDFITPLEYGKMLYQNPRGIGCDKCHGIKGEGKLIAKYKSKGKRKELVAPRINNISQKRFMSALNHSSKVMPTYFLTKNEVRSLYYYIMEINNVKEEDETDK